VIRIPLFGEPAADIAALVRSGFLRPIAPRVLADIGPRAFRDGLRPQLAYRLHALQEPDRLAWAFGDRTVTWCELIERVDRLANHLQSRGVGPGTKVAMWLSNRPEFIETQGALLTLRATAGFVAARAPTETAHALIERIAPAVLVTDREDVPPGVPILRAGDDYEKALRDASATTPSVDTKDEGKVVVYTSGTTGKPKGAVRSFSGASPRVLAGLLRVVPFRHDDVHLVAAPLYHATGSGFAQIAQVLGNTLVLIDRFSPKAFCEAVQRRRVTSTAVVPTMLHELTQWEDAKNYDLSSLRVVVTTGSVLRPNTRAAATELFGDVIYDLYGSTEMAWVSVATPDDYRTHPGTVGKTVPGVQVRILDENGVDVPRGRAGEIWASNRMMMEEYAGDETLTRERVRDGFVSVRDVGYQDADGYLYVVDRADDMLISGGVNVYPAETEAVLIEHPSVSQVAVVGIPDDKWGHRVVAAVVPRGTPTQTELIAWAKERLPAAAVPKEIRFVDSLPSSETGKIAKRTIAAEW
jgi:fatty-acyl-CoA synthase